MLGEIKFEHVTKNYGQKSVLEDIHIRLEPQKIYGLLGRNGAGKTTFLELIQAHSLPSAGQVWIDGEIPYENRVALSKIAFMKESNNFPKNITIAEVLRLCSSFYSNWDMSYATELLKQFQLDAKQKVKHLSKGMESTLAVIVGLASQASITIFDETYMGMDPVARHLFYDLLIKDYDKNRRTMILSTHFIDEITKLFERVIILSYGKVLLEEETDKLRQRAYYVSGKQENMEPFIQEKRVLHSETFAKQKKVAIWEELSISDRSMAAELQLEIDYIPTQQLIIYLTTTNRLGELN